LKQIELIMNSVEQTKRLAASLAPALQPGDVISLTGDLGAGKTQFAQGVADGLGVDEPVTSPTFTIIREYDGRLPLYHFDVYRLETIADLTALGYEEYFFGSGVTLIEWGDKVEALLPEDRLTIEMHRMLESENHRQLIINASGPRSEALLQRLAETDDTGL
jgi:tRNA threonylcarbamoyladenosine biosynthesis protein TsaE